VVARETEFLTTARLLLNGATDRVRRKVNLSVSGRARSALPTHPARAATCALKERDAKPNLASAPSMRREHKNFTLRRFRAVIF
jgi:hypothetical protein